MRHDTRLHRNIAALDMDGDGKRRAGNRLTGLKTFRIRNRLLCEATARHFPDDHLTVAATKLHTELILYRAAGAVLPSGHLLG